MNKKLTEEEAEDLLRRYRIGACTQREKEIIHHWYHSFDAQYGRTGKQDAETLQDVKREMILRINEKIDAAEPRSKQRFLSFNNVSRAAAALLVGVSALIFFYATTWRSGGMTAPVSLSGSSNEASHVVQSGAARVLYLSDGTVVWLKDDSKLVYPTLFLGSTREVELTGEAFFDVAPDREKPFIIHASNFTTRVVGTSFNIRAYRNDDAQEVVVLTGKVLVSLNEPSTANATTLVLHPNEKAVYLKKNNSLTSVVEEAAVAGALKRNKLVFDETPLEDIVKVLNANYQVNIVLDNATMNNCMITADLTNETIEVSVAILAKAINATYTIDGTDITLHGRGCGVQP